jgi:hypothetical protein
MKSRIFANLCLSLLLLFAQHVAFADAFSHHSHHTISDQTTQCALEEGSSSSDDGDASNHVSFDDFNGLVSAFVFPALDHSPQSQSQSLSGDFFTVLSQYYSTRAPPIL